MSGDIKAWLKAAGKTQRWLADQLDVTPQYISQVCAGYKVSSSTAYAIEDLSDGAVVARDLLLRGADPLAVRRERAA